MDHTPRQPINQTLAGRAARVKQLAQELGFAHVGFAAAAPSPNLPKLIQWLSEGKHGEMAYLAKNPGKRADPKSIMPGVKTVICVADRYPDKPTWTQTPLPVDTDLAATGKIARYAWGDDYHRSIKDRLHKLADDLREIYPEHEFVSVVDSGAILEREQAAAAGIGWVGKHTLIINPATGSWMLLGEILTTLSIQTASDLSLTVEDHCGSCTRCIDACPTNCITPYRVDGSKCISYLTIEHKNLIDPAMHGAMGNWLAGCDICQQVCPHNSRQPEVVGHVTRRDELPNPADLPSPAASSQTASQLLTQTSAQPTDQPQKPKLGPERFAKRYTTGVPAYSPQSPYHPGHATRAPGPSVGLLRILKWDEEARQVMLQRSALKRIKLPQFKRNALISAANFILSHPGHEESPALLQEIKRLSNDAQETSVVRETAKQCLARLGED